MRIVPYVLYVLLIAFHEVIFKDVTSVHAATINLPALLVVLVAVYKSELAAVWFGFVAGLIMSVAMTGQMGWFALLMAGLGLATWHVSRRLNLESLYSKMLLILGGILMHNIFLLLITGVDDFFYRLFAVALTGAIYTTVVAWVFFLFKEGHITYSKIRSLF